MRFFLIDRITAWQVGVAAEAAPTWVCRRRKTAYLLSSRARPVGNTKARNGETTKGSAGPQSPAAGIRSAPPMVNLRQKNTPLASIKAPYFGPRLLSLNRAGLRH